MILVSAPASRVRIVTRLLEQALAEEEIDERVVSTETLEPFVGRSWLDALDRATFEARLIVIDLTHAGPDVEHELSHVVGRDGGGVAESGVRVLLLAEDIDSVPPHLGTYQVLIYGGAERDAVRLLARHLDARLRSPGPVSPPAVFVSYAHEDLAHLDRLAVHMRPLVRDGLVDRWDDRRVRAGTLWRDQIADALARAAAAVLLVSADFYASDFIIEDELPPLLDAAQSRGVHVYPVIVGPCRYLRDDRLGRFAAHNDPAEPLASLPPWRQDAVYDSLTASIERDLVRK